jgi:hypothetical protein
MNEVAGDHSMLWRRPMWTGPTAVLLVLMTSRSVYFAIIAFSLSFRAMTAKTGLN